MSWFSFRVHLSPLWLQVSVSETLGRVTVMDVDSMIHVFHLWDRDDESVYTSLVICPASQYLEFTWGYVLST
jgi:hypothetical protein